MEDGLGTGGGGGTDDGMCSAAANDMGGGGGGGGDGAASSHSAAARRLAAAAQPASGPPNDFFYSGRHTLWHLSQVQAPVAWHASTGSNQVGRAPCQAHCAAAGPEAAASRLRCSQGATPAPLHLFHTASTPTCLTRTGAHRRSLCLWLRCRCACV